MYISSQFFFLFICNGFDLYFYVMASACMIRLIMKFNSSKCCCLFCLFAALPCRIAPNEEYHIGPSTT